VNETGAEVKDPFAPTTVDQYASASRNKIPLLYPGERPETSYLTDGENVYAIESTYDDEGKLSFLMHAKDGEVSVNDYLLEQGVPLMEDRIPILAFGANVSPGSLASKFAKVGRPDALIIPTVYAQLKGRDIVWGGGPGMGGYPIAVMYEGEETKDTSVQVAVNFLTPEQTLVMHASEMSYELSSVELEIDGQTIRAFYYAARDSVYLRDGQPVAIKSIPAEGRSITTSSAAEVLNEMIDDPEVRGVLGGSYPELAGSDAAQYSEYAISIPITDREGRRSLKKVMFDAIAARGKSKFAEPSDALKTRESWTNPSTLPTLGDQQKGILHHNVYRLPTQELGEWADTVARAKMLSALATHSIDPSKPK
jgi:hypothetical protein